ncbi:MAG: hypothetical protein K2N43_01745, partial [Lachnospiraceae bacterium]|nr:hypothetical protein [Lachnospiraceae bacterium]
MDTKWKKSKKIIGFTAFFLGWTLMIVNLIPEIAIWRKLGDGLFDSAGYQTSNDFRSAVSDRLMRLLAVATEGKSGRAYDAVLSEYYGYGGAYDSVLNEVTTAQNSEAEPMTELVVEEAMTETEYADYQSYLEEQQMHYDEMVAAELGIASEDVGYYYGYVGDAAYYGYGGDYVDYYYGYDFSDEKNRDAYMADMAPDKNILYAVAREGELLYTNIEALEPFMGQADGAWQDADFGTVIDPNEYNFTLWYNEDGDGKVRIIKDRVEQDVYGDGVYRDSSLWRVPGYTNFTLGESAENVVILLAAAKVPKLYMVGNDRGGVNTCGRKFYSLYQTHIELRGSFFMKGLYLSAGVILLFLAFLLRKDRRLAVERIAGLLGKICLELKMLLFLVVLTWLV